MTTPFFLHGLGTLLVLVLFSGAAIRGDEAKQEPGLMGDTLRQRQPPFLVRAEVNKPSRDFRQGDELSLRVATEEDAYVYVLYQQADGKTVQIFPNKHQPNNLVRARQAVDIPSKDDFFRWKVAAPFGTERIKVIASRTPLKSLSDPALVRERYNTVSTKQLKGVELELGPEKPPEWTESDLEIHTYAADQASQRPGARRFGVFFGVSEYQFNAEYEQASGKSLNLEGCNRDARTMAALLREVGQLSHPVQIYTNSLATRRQMEQAITQWLPRVSRPGDTVVIFFAGHGMLLMPPDSTKPDGDALLAPYDAVTPGMLVKLLERRREGKQLKEVSDVQLAEWVAIARQGGAALLRQTFIPDNEFAHWLQRLDGRQIIVILDCCHSGGFAGGGQGGAANGRDVAFNFMSGQVPRLRDIGQRECAVLAASKKEQPSQTRSEGDLGVMTHSLIETIRQTRGPVEIRRAFQECEGRMKKYFDDRNVQRKDKPLPAHQPLLYHSCTQDVYLKP